MSLLYNKLIESVKTAIYESLFDDIDDDIISDDNTTIIDNISNNYKFVNLGLPSGTLWCTKNLGAETETDPGNYYQWGYTEPVHAKRIFKTDYTKFNPSGNNKTFTKYSKNKVQSVQNQINNSSFSSKLILSSDYLIREIIPIIKEEIFVMIEMINCKEKCSI